MIEKQKFTVVAPVGKDLEALFVGIREFPTERVVLLSPKENMEVAKSAQKDLEKFKIPTKIVEVKGNTWEAIFKEVAKIRKVEGDKNLIVNVATGDEITRCAATSAAFVNGLKAFAVGGDKAMLLPVLKFSYYKLLTDKKMEILKTIACDKDCCSSLEELSEKTGMSLPLISYHINGNLRSEGLKQLGLIETVEEKGRVAVHLSTMGRLLINGYV